MVDQRPDIRRKRDEDEGLGMLSRATENGIGVRMVLPLVAILALAACEEGATQLTDGGGAAAATSVELVETDVEAPEIFQVTDQGLWDGRPSLGGVWVAHPDVTQPERVIIRNEANGTFVIGALFRRERENPGPLIQVSSDAAEALEMLAGAPARLNVTALRREEAAEPAAPAVAAAAEDAPVPVSAPADAAGTPLAAAEAMAEPVAEQPASGGFFSRLFGRDPAPAEAQPLDGDTTSLAPAGAIGVTTLDPIAGAAAAIEAAEAANAPGTSAAPLAPAPAASSDLSRPYIQLGIFSIEANATELAQDLQGKGLTTRVVAQESQGSQFWRVLVGPAATEGERAAWLEQVKAEGFADAYFVAN
jgi:cell division septation protein DedD